MVWLRKTVHSNRSAARSNRNCVLALLLLIGAPALTSCVAAGPYGYARTYSALDEEETAAEAATDYDPVMVARKPRAWVGKKVSLFGVVQSLGTDKQGNTVVLLGIRTLQGRNLCDSDDQSSCRVTVSEGEFGTVHARLKLRKVKIGSRSVRSYA